MVVYKVAPGRSILCNNHGLLKAGSIVPDGMLSAAEIQRKLEKGYIRPAEFMPEMPDNSVMTDPSPWTLNPDGLQKKTLEQLTSMIIERDEKFDDKTLSKDEAIEYLSADFDKSVEARS